MSRIIATLALLFAIVLIPFAVQSNAQPAQAAAPVVSCKTINHTHSVEIVCKAAGIVVLDLDVPLPTVTLPPVRVTVTAAPVTIHATKTVAGPTHTVTQLLAGPTATVTAYSTATTHQTTHQTATAHATATVTKTAAGQIVNRPATLRPDEPRSGFPSINFGGTVQTAALGTLALLVLVALVLLGMYLGYYLGYRDSDYKESSFLKSILRR